MCIQQIDMTMSDLFLFCTIFCMMCNEMQYCKGIDEERQLMCLSTSWLSDLAYVLPYVVSQGFHSDIFL